ncbi:MAG TPA: zinc ABC transporter substrate-binding protein [Candidatus Baltobacteraceae bacterium]|nr:zinc ABC transporter substrate-binding protein [Candidatus Baltobacteraceae bacterium]
MRRLQYFLLALAAASVGAVWFASTRQAQRPADAAVLSVHATFYPLAEAARRIGGARVRVETLTPPGAEPHDYEPSSRDIASIGSGGVFVMNGGVDAWADRILPDLRARGTIVVRAADALPEISKDPHVWLDPIRAKTIGERVRDALAEADPAHAADYRANAETYLGELDALDRAYEDGLKACGLRTVISSHATLGYLAARYGFSAIAIAGLEPDEEPSPRQMAEIADAAKKAGVKHIFFETLVSPKLSEAIASEIGAETLVFDPVEGLSEEAMASGEDYFSLMDANLGALRTAMACK